MDINGTLHFAPSIPFKIVDWDGDKLPEQFRLRIEGYYLEPAECCINARHAFASGLLLVSCIDALARLKYRRFDRNDAGGRFKEFLKELSTDFRTEAIRKNFYDDIRNGLVHEARLKNGAQFSLEEDANTTARMKAGLLLVNPQYLLDELRAKFNDYIMHLKTNEHERRLLSSSLRLDLEKDILTAQQYGS